MIERDAVVVLGGQPDVEVGAQRPGHLLGEELAQAAAGDAADDLADQEPLGERVVAGRGARLPLRGLRGQPCRDGRPVVEVLDVMGPSQSGSPAVCASTCRTSTSSLPAAANSGQYPATGASRSSSPRSARISAHSAVIVLVVDQTLVMVSRSHGDRALRVGVPAPDVDDRLAVHVHRHRGAHVPVVQQGGERTGHRGEQFVVRALYVSHGSH